MLIACLMHGCTAVLIKSMCCQEKQLTLINKGKLQQRRLRCPRLMVWEKTYFCPQEIIVIIGLRGCNSTTEIRCFAVVPIIMGLYRLYRESLDIKINMLISHVFKWSDLFEVLFSEVQSNGFKAVEFSGNHGFFHSVNAFSLKAKRSLRIHCLLLQIFNWN